MKVSVLVALLGVVLFSCSSGEDKSVVLTGHELFMKGNCQTCHLAKQNTIGPSVAEIKEVYATKQDRLGRFLRNSAPPLIEPEKFDQMKINLRYTEQLTEQEMDSLVSYLVK